MEDNGQTTENTQGIEGTEDKGKTYTSEEVSSIVQKRLASYKKSAAKDIETEYQEKFQELEKREKDFTLRSELSKRGMAEELANIISFTDKEDLDSKLDQLETIYGQKEEKKEDKAEYTGFQQIGGAESSRKRADSLESIFKPRKVY